jgi:WD40 repeat protein
VATRRLDATLNGGAGEVQSVAVGQNDKILADGTADGTVQLWDVASHHQTGSLSTGSHGAVLSLAFSRDGNTLAVSGADGTVQLWDVTTQQPAGRIPYSNQKVWSVAFSPDGQTLASGDAHKVRLWEMGYLVDTASRLCNSRQGPLTRAEWRQYVPPGQPYRAVCA